MRSRLPAHVDVPPPRVCQPPPAAKCSVSYASPPPMRSGGNPSILRVIRTARVVRWVMPALMPCIRTGTKQMHIAGSSWCVGGAGRSRRRRRFVARRFGVNRGLLQTWRRKAMGEAPVFVPLRVEGLVAAADNDKDRTDAPRSVAADADTSTRPGTLEIESGGVRVRFSGPVACPAGACARDGRLG